jgi:ferredoxin
VKVLVDRNLCSGEGLCERICPQLFEIVNRKCKAKVSRVPREAEAHCREAARHCPNKAIRLSPAKARPA